MIKILSAGTKIMATRLHSHRLSLWHGGDSWKLLHGWPQNEQQCHYHPQKNGFSDENHSVSSILERKTQSNSVTQWGLLVRLQLSLIQRIGIGTPKFKHCLTCKRFLWEPAQNVIRVPAHQDQSWQAGLNEGKCAYYFHANLPKPCSEILQLLLSPSLS